MVLNTRHEWRTGLSASKIADPRPTKPVAQIHTPMRLPLLSITLQTAVAVAILTFIFGCSSPHERREAFREKAGPPQPTLVATQLFLKGRIVVTAKLSASLPPRPAGGNSIAGEEGGRAGSRPAGGGRREGGGGDDGSRMGGRMGMDGGRGRPPGAGGMGGSMPRQALSIILANTSGESITLRIQEVVSILGNFVPFPERATLASGESVTLEPMRGSLANLDRLELTVALAAGNDRDRQTVILQRE